MLHYKLAGPHLNGGGEHAARKISLRGRKGEERREEVCVMYA